MKRYAAETDVSIGRSRGEIEDLLRTWKCSSIGWLDEFEIGRMTLQFQWKHEGVAYLARFTVKLPDDATLRKRSCHASQGYFLESKYDRMKQNNGRQEMRTLLIFLKGALNAVEAGILDPACVFLPFLVGHDGRTVAEVAIPRLRELLTSSADRLLLGEGAP